MEVLPSESGECLFSGVHDDEFCMIESGMFDEACGDGMVDVGSCSDDDDEV